jgi:acid phosphatase
MRVAFLCVFVALAMVSAVAEEPLVWLTLGDWGSGNNDQKAVAKQLGIYAQRYNASFLVTTGDNFYETGISSLTDPQWDNKWRKIYTSPSLQFKWYVSLGNHDHYGKNAQPEVDLGKKGTDPKWHLPNFYYKESFKLGSSNMMADFIFIDTVILCPNAFYTSSREELGEMNAGPDVYAEVDAQIERLRGDPRTEHMQWLNQTLKDSHADWRIAFGHYPVYSGGPHGNTPEMLRDIVPMFQAGKVDTFICGHDHSLQHLQGGGIDYYLSGAGTWKTSFRATREAKWGLADLGFTVHEMYADFMITRFIDWRGDEKYSHRLNRKSKL